MPPSGAIAFGRWHDMDLRPGGYHAPYGPIVCMGSTVVTSRVSLRRQIWRGRVRPLLPKTLAKPNNTVKANFLNYQEPVLVNFLEVCNRQLATGSAGRIATASRQHATQQTT